MEKGINVILTDFKKGEIPLDQAQRLILVLTGHRKNAACRLDRLQNDCSIWLYTNCKCEGCGHKY